MYKLEQMYQNIQESIRETKKRKLPETSNLTAKSSINTLDLKLQRKTK